jgi:carboxymethylenebutenolidase
MGKFMKGTYVAIAAEDGGSFKACLAKPEKGSGPGVVLLQELFGINQYIRDVADYYAEEDLAKYVPA